MVRNSNAGRSINIRKAPTGVFDIAGLKNVLLEWLPVALNTALAFVLAGWR